MPEEQSSIHEDIGKIVLEASILHVLAAQIISWYYQGNNDNYRRVSFIHDVLTNERANLSFITESLKRVLINLKFDKKYVEEKVEKKMRQIGNLRNEFAHEVPLYNEVHYLRNKKSFPFHGEGEKFKEKLNTFKSLYKEITDEFKIIINKKSIVVVDYIPNNYKPPTQEFCQEKQQNIP